MSESLLPEGTLADIMTAVLQYGEARFNTGCSISMFSPDERRDAAKTAESASYTKILDLVSAVLCNAEQAQPGGATPDHPISFCNTNDPAHSIGRTEQAFDFHKHLARQHEWSEQTFGPGPRVQGVLDHIRKELKEIQDKPDDLSEWIDVAILALDGAWRSGASPDQIIAALAAKQAKNEAREWPDWRTADPDKAIEHVREEK